MFNLFRKKSTKLPTCGNAVTYQQIYTNGKFFFKSKDCLNEILSRTSDNPHLLNLDEGKIKNWLKNSDTSVTSIIDVSDYWNRFEYCALHLIEQNLYTVYCGLCGDTYKELILQDASSNTGWTYSELYCPNSHLLIKIKRIHAI